MTCCQSTLGLSVARSSSFCNVVTHVDDQAPLAGRVMARIDNINKAENQEI